MYELAATIKSYINSQEKIVKSANYHKNRAVN